MTTDSDQTLLRDLQALETRLDCIREAISRELADIPPPVPACDVHFNRLLEDRGRVVDTLQLLRKLRSEQASPAALASILASGCALEAATRRRAQDAVGTDAATAAASLRR
jgi:hypothetical protein